jgi:hypothetical protein
MANSPFNGITNELTPLFHALVAPDLYNYRCRVQSRNFKASHSGIANTGLNSCCVVAM